MTIKSRLRMTFMVVLVLSMLGGAAIFWSHQKIIQATAKSDLTREIGEVIQELNSLVYEAVLHPGEERMPQQWQATYPLLSSLLEKGRATFHQPGERAALETIGKDVAVIQQAFERLIRVQRTISSPQNSLTKLEKRLASQIQVKARHAILHVAGLGNRILEEIRRAQDTGGWIIGIISVLLMAFVFGALSLTERKISRPIQQLQEGVKLVADGNLRHRVNAVSGDEVGELTLAFNHMVQTIERGAAELEAVTHSSIDAIISANENGRICFWNQGAELMLGYSGEEILGQPLTRLMPERFREAHTQGLQRAHATGELRLGGKVIEITGLRKDGSEFPLELSLVTWRIEDKRFFSSVIRDITKRKQMEDALKKANEEMESRVKERTRELTSLNEDLHREVEKRNLAQQALSRSLLDQEIIAAILKLSLQPLPLVDILRQSLMLVLQRHGLGLSLQGCVFLLDEDTGELVMKVRHGLPESILESCGRLPLGRCLCGLAAQSGKVIHADGIDERHELTYAGIKPHGHYCVPIQDKGELFGVLNLYVPDGHQQTMDEEQLILAIADTLAGVIRHRRTEDALRASEADLSEAQRIAHLGSWNWDIVQNKLTWSAEIFRIFGIPQNHFGATYEAFLDSVHPVDRDRVKQAVDAALYKRQGYSIEHRILLPDGAERTVHERAKVDFDADGQPVRMFGTVQDVTEQKRIKETLGRLKDELEKKERNRLAALLHDGVGQNLQAVNLGLKMVAQKADPEIAKILAGLNGEVRNTIEQIRDLSSELSPVRLEQMDLAEAMRSQVSKLSVRVKADIRVITDRSSYAFLDERIKEHCFLIFQEALTNAIKHSDASVIEIRLSVVDEVWLLMEISDSGAGFSPRRTSELDSGLGMSIIQDRAQGLGGKADIRSAPGKGARVTVRIPLQ
jgi:PAS domain S-box-containing protein